MKVSYEEEVHKTKIACVYHYLLTPIYTFINIHIVLLNTISVHDM